MDNLRKSVNTVTSARIGDLCPEGDRLMFSLKTGIFVYRSNLGENLTRIELNGNPVVPSRTLHSLGINVGDEVNITSEIVEVGPEVSLGCSTLAF